MLFQIWVRLGNHFFKNFFELSIVVVVFFNCITNIVVKIHQNTKANTKIANWNNIIICQIIIFANPRNRTQQLQCTGFCLFGWSRSISIARYETTRNQDQRKTRRAVRRHYKLHPNENQLRTSEELCSLLEGMSCPQASCSQWDFD